MLRAAAAACCTSRTRFRPHLLTPPSYYLCSTAARLTPEVANDLSAARFHQICDLTLEQLSDQLSVLELALNDDTEVECSQGILKLNMAGDGGTWIINKQTPNRQIWWSSPISGPRRYELDMQKLDAVTFDADNNTTDDLTSIWRFTRDGSALGDTMAEEMLQITGMDIRPPKATIGTQQ